MNAQALTDEIKQFARTEGADLVGIAPISRYEGAPHMLRPQAHLPEAKAVIVMAVHHPDASVEWAGEPNPNFSGPFQIGMIAKLDTIALRVSRFIELKGHTTMPLSCTFYWRHRPYKDIPYAQAASFSHMNAFVAAGLGEYGWHGMVMSPEYGPRQRIISVITDAPLAADPLYNAEPLCDRCNLCEKKCWGNNYVPEHLNKDPEISFTIEGKTFRYANVNRWRCFWGEQCHLDMNELAKRPIADEHGIFQAMNEGVKRAGQGAAGYQCSSFKHCMAKPIRTWDKALSPGPRRKKALSPESGASLIKKVKELAARNNAHRISIQPLSTLQNAPLEFYKGFRKDELFRTFTWAVTIAQPVSNAYADGPAIAKKNAQTIKLLTHGRMMMGVLDIARYLDDAGYEAMQMWRTTAMAEHGVSQANWKIDGQTFIAETVITTAPLDELNEILIDHKNITGEAIAQRTLPSLSHVDAAAIVSLDDCAPEIAKSIRESMPDAKTLVAVSAGIPRRVVELAGKQEAECGVSYQYLHYQSQRESAWAAQDIASDLAAEGHAALALVDLSLDSRGTMSNYLGVLPDLHAQSSFAAAAGLGVVGKNGLLLTENFGPRQRYAFVVTDAVLTPTKRAAGSLCPQGCTACADACPMKALNASCTLQCASAKNVTHDVFPRDEVKCEWARSLGMVDGEGVELLGWQVPNVAAPAALTDDERKKAKELKDPVQRICYGNPNHSDTIIERCLQACPAGRR
ncbi:MAG: hypothetical protein HZC28_20560 [Spirochaetes bacterium]|nr:hypothetical protein [Spirochaetota bacterium]